MMYKQRFRSFISTLGLCFFHPRFCCANAKEAQQKRTTRFSSCF